MYQKCKIAVAWFFFGVMLIYIFVDALFDLAHDSLQKHIDWSDWSVRLACTLLYTGVMIFAAVVIYKERRKARNEAKFMELAKQFDPETFERMHAPDE